MRSPSQQFNCLIDKVKMSMFVKMSKKVRERVGDDA
jgi:hypothetical protein